MIMIENVRCENCEGFQNIDDALFDEQTEVFFCDDGCFEEWADDHFEELVEHYKSFHVYAG